MSAHIHPIAAAHARALDSYDALTIALHDPAQVSFEGLTDSDVRALHVACAAMTYKCTQCERDLPVSAYDRDSHGCDLCTSCYEDAGMENAHADGYHDDAPDPDCPACKGR